MESTILLTLFQELRSIKFLFIVKELNRLGQVSDENYIKALADEAESMFKMEENNEG